MRRARRVARSDWFQVLVGGLLFPFYLLNWALQRTQNPNLVLSLLVLGAFLVPVVLVLWAYEHPIPEPIPPSAVVWNFLWGGSLGIVVAGILEYDTYRSLGVLPLLAVGFIEESAKLLVPLVFFLRWRYRSERAGLLFGLASGMGFAALETLGYGITALVASRGNVGLAEFVLLVRGFLSPAGHAAWTGLVTATLWRERARHGHAGLTRATIGTFFLAVALHTLWDTFQVTSSVTRVDRLGIEVLSAGVALLSLTMLVRRYREARRQAVAVASATKGSQRNGSPS
ncbi:MAG: PrsW family intramembrane metalloprotease [Thermomicrobium sp.]|nr:PrsW family intramembrane metalloprotease [Thermomicrobium sp.]